jgi:hypothetical protein
VPAVGAVDVAGAKSTAFQVASKRPVVPLLWADA